MFETIYLHNWRKPLLDRVQSRKVVGPYRWTPSQPGRGRGFYWADGTESPDSTFRLRMEIVGREYAFNEFGEGYQGFVARLPRSRGFMAGATMGEHMASFMDPEIYDDEDDAASMAIALAKNAAEIEAEYQEGEAA